MTSVARAGLVLLIAGGSATTAGAQVAPPPASLTQPAPQVAPTRPSQARPAPARPAPEKKPVRRSEPKQARPAKTPAPKPSSATKTPPAQGIQGWFPMPQGAAPTPRPPAQLVALTPERVRPPASLLIDCKDAPSTALTQVPEPLNRWATIYCTKRGHMFSANDRFFALYPGTKVRGALNAAELTGRTGELGHAAHFTRITHTKLSVEASKALMVGLTPETAKIVEGKELFQVDLTTDTGQTYSLAAVNPSEDPFWVIPVVQGRLNNRGFYVASLDYINKNR